MAGGPGAGGWLGAGQGLEPPGRRTAAEQRSSAREVVAMQIRRRRGGWGELPSPRGPPVAKTDHSPEQSPRNGRCHSSLSRGQPAALPGRAGSGCSDLRGTPSPLSLYLREGSGGLGLSLELGEGVNWIGTLQKHISCTSLGETGGGCGVGGGRGGGGGSGGRLQTVFVMTGLSLTLPAATP